MNREIHELGILFKTFGLLIILLTILGACSPTTGMSITQYENLKFLDLEGKDFLINQDKYSEIKHCVSNNNIVKTQIINFGKEELDGLDLKNKDPLVTRRVIKRGNISRGIPSRYLRQKPECATFLCVNQVGDVVLTKVIDSNFSFKDNEMKRFLSIVSQYKFEEKLNSDCLECGRLTVMFDAM